MSALESIIEEGYRARGWIPQGPGEGLSTLPALPSLGSRGGEDRHGLREAEGTAGGCDHTWDTHLAPVLGHDGTCRVTLRLPKDPRLESYQSGT